MNTTVEVDFTQMFNYIQSLSGLFWIGCYLVAAFLIGLVKIRSEVKEDLKVGPKPGECPTEIAAVFAFSMCPLWIPFYLVWLILSYPNKRV